MQVLFVLRFYLTEKTDKIDRLIHASSSKMAVKMSSVVKQLLYVLNLFRFTAGCIHSFRILSKETFRIMYPKYPVLDIIQRIHLRCGSFGSTIRFSILVKKRYIRFWIKNPDLDFSKETHSEFQLEWQKRRQRIDTVALKRNKFKVSDFSSLNFIRLQLRVVFSS